MFELLYKYFILHKRIDVPGIGCFTMAIQPAQNDFVHRVILPPVPEMHFSPGCDTSDKGFVQFVAGEIRSDINTSAEKVSAFFTTLQAKLGNNEVLELPFFGIVQQGTDELVFKPGVTFKTYFPPAIAERIVRDNAEHHILVGDAVRTNTQMIEHFEETSQVSRPDRWWIFAIIIGLIAVAAIAWYYWQLQSVQQV